MRLASNAAAFGVAAPAMHTHAGSASAVMAPRAADSDGGSCPDLNCGLGGGMDDTSSVLHSAGSLPMVGSLSPELTGPLVTTHTHTHGD